MPVTVERLPNEPIVIATIHNPFAVEQDIPAMYAQLLPLYKAIEGRTAFILDVRGLAEDPYGFSQMVMAMDQASKEIKASKTSGLSGPPHLILVGSGPLATIAAEGMAQEQYGGLKGDLCSTREEAIALARRKKT